VATTSPTEGLSGAEPNSRLRELLAELGSVLDDVHDLPWSCLDRRDVAKAVKALPALSAKFDAARSAMLRAGADQNITGGSRCRTMRHYLTHNTTASGRDVGGWLRRAEWLRDFDEFAEAHADGILTAAHLEHIRKGLHNGRTFRALQRDQAIFVTAAHGSFKDFERACAYWMIAADPDGEEPRYQLEKNGFTARRRADGMVETKGLSDALSGTVFLTALNKEIQKLRRIDDENGRTRTEAQLGHEALLRLVARGAARSDGTQPEPLINIVMSLDVAKDQMRRMAEGGLDQSDLPVDANDLDSRCELIDGTPIHPHLAMSLLCIARLERVVMTAPKRIHEASLPTRGFAKWQRRLAAIRQRGRCANDDCDAPFPWLQADHIHPWSKGGPTSLDNCQLYCCGDNQAKGDRLPDQW